ncbi:DUF2793 domain-containing protein [Hyphomicrobium sp. NDB2Meth4]|uniref:DUF2793 domain-containing protein n=1 Tax=Hyphomicrobium sp. NDB2Meth4 TaxID=1892846 RepID=UPI0009303A1B|nr:DUF2793 domain-containing protein [Hyphomicrobium sp. NDB2Meth4]
MDDTPNLGLPYIMAAQSQKHVTHNEAIRALDAIVQLSVLDRDLSEPPESPAEGARYIVADSPIGAWADHAGDIAAYQDGAWMLYAPREGWIAWVADEETAVVFSGSAWTALSTGEGGGGGSGDFATLGINTDADTTNRLAVSADATLLSHDGNDHRLKINKATTTDTASLLYQTGFSGRAEMGLAGDDDFHFKVSADGTSWNEAIVIDKDTGAVSFPNTTIGGSGGVGGPGSSTDGNIATFDGTSGDAISDSGKAVSIDGTFAANSDAKVPTEKAVKTYVASAIDAVRDGVSSAYDTLAELAAGLAGKLTAASNLSDLASAATARTNLGLAIGTNVQAYSANLTTFAAIAPSSNVQSLLGAANYAAMRAQLDLEAGTDFYSKSAVDAAFQPLDSDLTAVASLSPSNDDVLQRKSGSWTNRTPAQLTADLSAFTGDSGSGGIKGLVPAPTAGDAAGGKFLRADGSWAAPAGGGGSATRELLTAARTYYVRTDGSDTNNGLANTSGGAFATMQKALDVVGTLDLSIYDVTVQVAAGTYTAGVSLSGAFVGAGSVTLRGDPTTPANVVISTTGSHCISASGDGVHFNVSGFKLQTTTSGSCLSAGKGARISVTGAIEFGSAATYHCAADASNIDLTSISYKISGGAGVHFASVSGANISAVNCTVTLTGTPAFATAFAYATSLSMVVSLLMTYSGSATGKRYDISGNSVVNTFGGGASALPGGTAGSTATGGQYL